MGAPAYVQFGIADNTASPLVISRSGTTAGNMLCVVAVNTGTANVTFNTPTDDVTNSYKVCTNATASSGTLLSGGFIMQSWYAINKASGTRSITVSYTGTQGNVAAYVFEIKGANTFDIGAGAAGTATGGPGQETTGNFTTKYQDIIICVDAQDAGTGTAGTGYTLIELDPDWGWALEYGLFNAGTHAGLVTYGFVPDHGIIAAAFGSPPANLVQYTDTIFYGIT